MDDDIPEDWAAAIAEAQHHRRLLVLGATDMGKSSFIRALARTSGPIGLIDLDPGQKMAGPPGTVGYGRLGTGGETELRRMNFLGSTAIGSFSALAAAAASLAELASRDGGFVANSSGYVRGPGARLQAMTAAALQTDLIVEIGEGPAIVPQSGDWPCIRIRRSPLARKKSDAVRASIRQAAFASAMADAREQGLALPAPPNLAPFEGEERPVCALFDEAGVDMAVGVLVDVSDLGLRVAAPVPVRPAKGIKLGSLWAAPAPEGWRLSSKLKPAA